MWKFLTPDGATYYKGRPFYYNLPQVGEKWSTPTFAPNMASEPDGKDCGEGGLHLMKDFSAAYAPNSWWPWYAEPVGKILGESDEKVRCQGVKLRRVGRFEFWRMIRLGWVRDANLPSADLRYADLRGADLWCADLRYADLRDANLRYADLRGADLRDADLRDAIITDKQKASAIT